MKIIIKDKEWRDFLEKNQDIFTDGFDLIPQGIKLLGIMEDLCCAIPRNKTFYFSFKERLGYVYSDAIEAFIEEAK